MSFKDRRDNSGHGPAYGEAIGDILTNSKTKDSLEAKKLIKNILKNSSIFPKKKLKNKDS
jgi:hypothetical protein